ncbi:hypothetical protein O1M07_07750 [Streptomyces albulus]|nr:hypothetical protein [Streptomyces noursei]MCZ1014124.1 hypothetical protein [Streptomyces noursei]GGX24292.1 hypothetical protein GCM10010341_51900 [Streptomyces noursei]
MADVTGDARGVELGGQVSFGIRHTPDAVCEHRVDGIDSILERKAVVVLDEEDRVVEGAGGCVEFQGPQVVVKAGVLAGGVLEKCRTVSGRSIPAAISTTSSRE